MSTIEDKLPAAGPTTYWRKTLKLTLGLGALWLIISLAPLLLAKLPDDWTLLGWPVAYAVVAFVAPLSYLLLIGLYAWRMARLDRAHLKSSDHAAHKG